MTAESKTESEVIFEINQQIKFHQNEIINLQKQLTGVYQNRSTIDPIIIDKLCIECKLSSFNKKYCHYGINQKSPLKKDKQCSYFTKKELTNDTK